MQVLGYIYLFVSVTFWPRFPEDAFGETCVVRYVLLLFLFSNHHHHHLVLLARITLTIFCHPSLSSITPGMFSRQRPISTQSCCIQVLAGCLVFARPCEGVHMSMSLMSSSLLLQQCPACLFHLTLIVFVMGGRWLYSCCFVACCLQDLFNTAGNILVWLLSSFFSICLVNIHIVHPCSNINTTTAWKKTRFYFIGQVWLPYDQ